MKINSRIVFTLFIRVTPRPALPSTPPSCAFVTFFWPMLGRCQHFIKCHGVKRTCHLIFRPTISVRVVGVKEGPKSVRFSGKSRICILHIFRVTAWDLSRA